MLKPHRDGSRKQGEKLLSARRGMTLVEVLAAALIMGGIVTTALVGQAKALRQITAAERTVQAANLARELLASWEIENRDLSSPYEGAFDTPKGWRWRRRDGSIRLAGGVEVREVTLDIEYQGSDTQVPWRREFRWLSQNVENEN